MTKPEALLVLGLEPIFELLSDVSATLTGFRYRFFYRHELTGNDVSQRYWIELLGRAHLASSTALLRQHRWMTGMVDACTSDNFIVLAACFRGFLESSADIWDGLNGVATGLAVHFAQICDAVTGSSSQEILLAESLENQLIHFSFAQSRRRPLLPDAAAVAKRTDDYITALEGSSAGPFHDCYAELCEITHPAAESTLYFVRGTSTEWELTNTSDGDAIRSLCARHGPVLPDLAQRSVNPALLVLKTLNEFPVDALRTPIMDEIQLDDIRAWRTIKSTIATSRLGRSVH